MTKQTTTTNERETMTTRRPVVICTKYRGVFFGYAEDTSGDTVTIYDYRMCVYWHSSVRGVIGLASDGPNGQCRVTGKAPSIELRGVTAVMEATDAAVSKWEKGPWG
jgi:hypothetical protein